LGESHVIDTIALTINVAIIRLGSIHEPDRSADSSRWRIRKSELVRPIQREGQIPRASQWWIGKSLTVSEHRC
jgi:hypothetical protein